jgi:hypothetical protein
MVSVVNPVVSAKHALVYNRFASACKAVTSVVLMMAVDAPPIAVGVMVSHGPACAALCCTESV